MKFYEKVDSLDDASAVKGIQRWVNDVGVTQQDQENILQLAGKFRFKGGTFYRGLALDHTYVNGLVSGKPLTVSPKRLGESWSNTIGPALTVSYYTARDHSSPAIAILRRRFGSRDVLVDFSDKKFVAWYNTNAAQARVKLLKFLKPQDPLEKYGTENEVIIKSENRRYEQGKSLVEFHLRLKKLDSEVLSKLDARLKKEKVRTLSDLDYEVYTDPWLVLDLGSSGSVERSYMLRESR